MSYTKKVWSGTTPITAKDLNHAETQYDSFVSDVSTHNHDDSHYTKTESDERFFHTGNMGNESGFDADKLDGNHIENILTTLLPPGAILMWSGADTTVPTGWAICNGQVSNGYTTPDLRDRFVVGAGDSYAPNATGGGATFTPTATLTIGNHTLTAAELPSHAHNYTEKHNPAANEGSFGGAWPSAETTTARTANNQTSGNSAHGHAGSTVTFSAVDARPPYYTLYFIIKVS